MTNPMLPYFTDTYMHHESSINQITNIIVLCGEMLPSILVIIFLLKQSLIIIWNIIDSIMMKFAETHVKGTWNGTSVIKSIYVELEMVFQLIWPGI